VDLEQLLGGGCRLHSGPIVGTRRPGTPKGLSALTPAGILDLNVGGGRAAPHDDRVRRVDAEIDRLLALGATRHRVFEERGEYWVAMLDPEGNEFDLQ
jgi:hypothetical protein